MAKRSDLACPRCASPLFEGRASDVVLLGCGECAGIWLDNTSARLALKTLDRRINELAARATAHALKSPARNIIVKCPACQKAMERTRTKAGVVEVDLDICAEHGTWFDRGELGLVLDGLRVVQAPLPLATPLAPSEIPDFKAGTLTPDPVDAGLVVGGAFAVLGAILAASSKS